jgi:DNA-directed RNA polymerase omega subunit
MTVSTQAPECQFAYVVVVARRARQLMFGGRPLVENPRALKTTRIAEEELNKGLLEFDLQLPVVNLDGQEKPRRS